MTALGSIFLNVGAQIVTAMESKWRGANGEVGGEAGDEYALWCSVLRELRRGRGRIGGITESCPTALQSEMAGLERQKEDYNSQTLEL